MCFFVNSIPKFEITRTNSKSQGGRWVNGPIGWKWCSKTNWLTNWKVSPGKKDLAWRICLGSASYRSGGAKDGCVINEFSKKAGNDPAGLATVKGPRTRAPES